MVHNGDDEYPVSMKVVLLEGGNLFYVELFYWRKMELNLMKTKESINKSTTVNNRPQLVNNSQQIWAAVI